ncbi:HesB/YadR/YfhF family protein [Pseudogracilibacillus auburnensis]|uniref:HesB/YadR/YfhF family protein n=1 Tax=Pseudogracilibacillus auburnensis TaxID=1494959 RepID=UPI001A964488|nr:hypothetical protein [Pseudogracilibacillus auburnensis]MBO1004599.1 hypothetical protein [Pseudogracilibacillus auburnensis]
MDIVISEEAVQWYKKELEISHKETLRFFVRYGGVGGHIPGFSLGINIEEPNVIHTSTTVNDIQFFIEEDDAWYFADKDLVISYDKEMDEPQFTYQ